MDDFGRETLARKDSTTISGNCLLIFDGYELRGEEVQEPEGWPGYMNYWKKSEVWHAMAVARFSHTQ